VAGQPHKVRKVTSWGEKGRKKSRRSFKKKSLDRVDKEIFWESRGEDEEVLGMEEFRKGLF